MTFKQTLIAGIGLIGAAAFALPGAALAQGGAGGSASGAGAPTGGNYSGAAPSGGSSNSTMSPSSSGSNSAYMHSGSNSASMPSSSSNSASTSSHGSSMSENQNGMNGQNGMNESGAQPSKQEVLAAQKALKSHGENVSTDGIWGPETQAAVKHFQQQNGLTATGQLDTQTMQKLNVANQG